MKKIKVLFAFIAIMFFVFQSNAQFFDPDELIDWHDPNYVEDTTKTTAWSFFGKTMTPKDSIRFLIIYAGFTNDFDFNSDSISPWPYLNPDDNNSIGTSFPRNPEQFIYSDINQFSDTATDRSISNFFYTMSMQKDSSFKVMADIFPERINVPLDSVTAWLYDPFAVLTKRVFDTIQSRYPTFDWSKYDNRKTKTSSFINDDRFYNPDYDIDYVIISFRYARPDSLQIPDSIRHIWYAYGKAGAYADIYDYTFHNPVTNENYKIKNGFTVFKGINSIPSLKNTFVHEWAHSAFDSPHVSGANGVVGQHYYASSGWNMCNNGIVVFNCSNAWERWWLNWTDIKYDLTDVADNGIYEIEDFITTGDAIRIKIPYVNNQYLWLEYHSGENTFDHKDLFQNLGNGPAPESPVGLVAYIENIGDNRNNTSIFTSGANGIKTIDMQGNYDYSTDISNYETWVRWWDNRAYNFNIIEENPYGSNNALAGVRMDYYTNTNDNIPNGNIDLSTHTNSSSLRNEKFLLFKLNNEYVDGPMGANIAFAENQEFNVHSNPALFNYQTFNRTSQKLSPIYLHGINIKLISYTGNSAIVQVEFNNYLIDNSVRMCGDIILVENVPLILQSNKTLSIDKSNTAQRENLLNGEFINPTIFTCNENSTFTQQANSTVIVKNESTLKLKSGSTYIIENGATLLIKGGCTLETEACSKIVINGTGRIFFEDQAYSCIAEGTILDFENGLQNYEQDGDIIACVGNISVYDVLPPSYSITTSTNWTNKNYQINRSLEIKQGGILNIIGGNIRCLENSKVEVLSGGKLIIDGATLTSSTYCDNKMWQGIYLTGDQTAHQSATTQPVIELTNGAVIENSVNGVFAGSVENPGNVGGGIIYADNVTFKNCGTGISMQSYHNFNPSNPSVETNNLSHIYKCTFETNAGYYNFDDKPYAGIALWDVKGIDIKGNTFINSAPESITPGYRGYGVAITGADCTIEGYCNDPFISPCDDLTPNTFTSLYKGIYNTSTSNNSNIKIDGNEFTNNLTAIDLRTLTDGIVSRNIINLSTKGNYGIYLNTCRGYTIEENTITGNNNYYGIYVYNSVSLEDEIYKNTISNVNFGIYANKNSTLQLKCNKFNYNNYHVYATNNGLYRYQGSSSLATGNEFLPQCSLTQKELYAINMDVRSISYYYFDNSVEDEEPLCHTSYVSLFRIENENTCPSHLGGGLPQDDAELIALRSTITGQETELASLVDGGNTQITINQIENVEEGEEIKLMNALLSKSPFLSDTALIKTAVEEEVLPEVVITNVLVANPQAAKSMEVQIALDNRVTPMPVYLRDAIDQGLTLISEKEVLETGIFDNKLAKSKVISSLITKYQNDTLTDQSSEIEEILLGENNLNYDYQLIEHYISKNKLAEAEQLFNSLPSKYQFSADELTEYQEMSQLLEIEFDLENRNYFNLSEIQKNTIYSLAENGITRASMISRGIIFLVDTVEYPDEEIVIEKTMTTNETSTYNHKLTLELSPNPATDYFVAAYDLGTEKFSSAQFKIYNSDNQQAYNQEITISAYQLLIETTAFEPGVYVCKLYSDNIEIAKEPIIIKADQITEIINEQQIEELMNNEGFFLVYPNPAKDLVTICTNEVENSTIEIYDNIGRKVYQTSVNKSITEVPVNNFETGIYIIQLMNGNNVLKTVKLVVE
jgi:hypothetical protein